LEFLLRVAAEAAEAAADRNRVSEVAAEVAAVPQMYKCII
jgi:hypothetical protein